MNEIYEKLFDTYADPILREHGGYNEDEINKALAPLSLDRDTQLEIDDLFSRCYLYWSIDAFTVGLHLGLSLLGDQVRPPRSREEPISSSASAS